MKFRICLVVAASALLAFAGSASAQQPIVIKFSHVVAVDTPKGKAAEYFKKLAEERTKGRVKVEVYPNSQLYKDGEEMEALQLGSVQMLAPSVAKFGPLGVREFEVFDLPYIFDSFAELHKVTEGPVGKKLFKKLETKGIAGLAFWDNGFKDMSANKPLQSPGDFKGLKMRIQSSKVLEARDARAGRDPAGDGVLRGLPGAADRRRRRHRESAVELLHAEDARGAEVPDADRPRRHRVRGDRQQEVLGRPAGRHPHDARRRDEGCDQVRQRHRARRRTTMRSRRCKKSGKTEIITLTAEQKAEWKKALVPVHQEMEARDRQGHDRGGLQGNRLQALEARGR